MGRCAFCDEKAGFEVFIDDAPEMLCREHAREWGTNVDDFPEITRAELEGELLRNQLAELLESHENVSMTAITEEDSWSEWCDSAADALLARFDVRLRVPQEETPQWLAELSEARQHHENHHVGAIFTNCSHEECRAAIERADAARVPQEEETP